MRILQLHGDAAPCVVAHKMPNAVNELAPVDDLQRATNMVKQVASDRESGCGASHRLPLIPIPRPFGAVPGMIAHETLPFFFTATPRNNGSHTTA